ncbi:hypothetical protein AZ044_000346, partial [Pluralibacter gergoviae]
RSACRPGAAGGYAGRAAALAGGNYSGNRGH